jgi:hypothetical protein
LINHKRIGSFIVLILVALGVSETPYVHWPFTWTQTFFHEVSHGLMALITGGKVLSIEINLNGSGLCTYSGGFRPIIAFSGYFGSVLWGVLIYSLVDNLSKKSADKAALFILFILAVSLLLYTKDPVTAVILLVISIPFLVILKTRDIKLERLVVKFIAVYVVLDAVKAPLHLLDGKNEGDGATLQSLLLLPEVFWVALWFLLGLLALIKMFMDHLKLEKTEDW